MHTHLLFALGLGLAPLPLQGSTVQATMVGRYFMVDAQVNGKNGKFIVDTGAGLSCVTPAAAKRMGIEGGMEIPAQGTGEKQVPARLTKFSTFKVGEALVKDDNIVVIDLPPSLRCDGLVGYSFLRHFVVTLDYASAQLTFGQPGNTIPKGTLVDMRVRQGHPQVAGSILGKEGWLTLDTGANGALTVMKPFADANGLSAKFASKEPRVVGKGVGGFTKGFIATLDSIRLGSVALPPVPSVISTQTKGAFASNEVLGNVGAEIMNRFTITLDYPGQKAYFLKNATFDRPYAIDRSGVWLDHTEEGFKIVDVAGSSPGKDAGLEVGDTILEIDGVPTGGQHPLEVNRPLQQVAGTKVKLRLTRAGRVIDVELTLRDLG